MDTHDYTTLLLKLAKDIRKIAYDARDKKIISTVDMPILKTKIEQFEQKEDGSSSYTRSFEQITKKEWSREDILKVTSTQIKETTNYKKIIQLISEKFSVNIAQADFWVENFSNILARESLNGASEERIIELSIKFIMELEGSPKYWYPILWINGLIVKEDFLQITDSLTIRKIKPADLEREWNLEYFPFIRPIDEDLPHSIIELRLRGKNQPEIFKELEKIILTLRFFKVGSIESIKTNYGSDSLMWISGGGTQTKNFPSHTSYRYELTQEDAAKLSQFLKEFPAMVPPSAVGDQGEIDHSVIAIQRYNDALMKPEIFESRLSFGIMALEALFLKKELESGELEHRLSQRVARLLSLYNYKPLEVFNTLKRSYSIRSSYVHGSPIPKEDLKQAQELTEKVLDYVRLSIIIFLQMKKAFEKDKLLSLIDNSLLSEEAYKKLSQALANNCQLT